jgi:DNA-binding transcriptional regulator YiaG
MTPEEFRSIRQGLSLRQRDAAWMFNVLPRQIVRWEAGSYPIPAPVSMLLTAYRDGLISPRWLVEHLGPPQ